MSATTYRVHFGNEHTTVVDVTVDGDEFDPEALINLAGNSDDMPGSIGYGAYGDASVDPSDWEPREITTEAGAVLWTDDRAVADLASIDVDDLVHVDECDDFAKSLRVASSDLTDLAWDVARAAVTTVLDRIIATTGDIDREQLGVLADKLR
jgi:hypothetical protein